MKDNVTQEELELEAATAVAGLKSAADLDSRIGIVRERMEVASDRLMAFIVTMPEGYTLEDRAVFANFINDTLEKLAEEANEQVKFERTWNRLGE